MTAEELMDQYKMVREEEFGLGLGLIINPDAQVGGILLVGMNPSGKGDDIYSFNECEGAFWNPKHDMLGGRGRGYDTKCGYIDLLPVRNGNQSKVHLDNDIKNRYHGRLLAHTRDYIEELRPRLIIFANATARYYWEFNDKDPWMGYTFKKIESPLEGERKKWELSQITGIKPTYGRVSRYGQIAYGSSLDQIGPMAKDVTDCAAVLEIISGHDPKDSTSANRNDTDFTTALQNDVKGMKIGVPKDYFLDGIDEEVKEKVLAAAEKFREMGAEVEYFDLGMVKYAIPAYYIIACAEASSNLERFDGVKYGYRTEKYTDLNNMYKKTRSEGFGDEVKRRIMLGSFVLSSGYFDAYYVKALRVKALIKQAFDKAFEKYDVVLGPVAPTTALKIGESLSDPIKMYLGDVYTVSINLTGIPAVSLPCGYDKDGLPIGLQLMGQTFNEKAVIKAAYSFEQNFKENSRHSPLYE